MAKLHQEGSTSKILETSLRKERLEKVLEQVPHTHASMQPSLVDPPEYEDETEEKGEPLSQFGKTMRDGEDPIYHTETPTLPIF